MNEIEDKIKELLELAEKHDLNILIAVSDKTNITTAKGGDKLILQGLLVSLMFKLNEKNSIINL